MSVIVTVVAVVTLLATCCTCDVDPSRMENELRQHFSQTRHHRTNNTNKLAARKYIKDQFTAMGLEIHIHEFPSAADGANGINIIGVLRGQSFNTSSDNVVAISAHYDTMPATPGVNDNGAAVVVMLEAAREVTRHSKRNGTVLFIAFDFEEGESHQQAGCTTGLCGSDVLVNQWLPTFLAQEVIWSGLFNMDVIMNFDSNQSSQEVPPGFDRVFPKQSASVESDGEKGDFVTVIGRESDQNLVKAFASAWNGQGQAEYEIEEFVVPDQLWQVFNDFLRSDHANFWQKGKRAIFLTDSANFRGYMQQCYHNSCDSLEYLTPSRLNFISKTCRSLVSVVNTLAPADTTSSSASTIVSWLVLASSVVLMTVIGWLKE